MIPEDVCSEQWCDREAEIEFEGAAYCKQHRNLSNINSACDKAEMGMWDWPTCFKAGVMDILEALGKINWRK